MARRPSLSFDERLRVFRRDRFHCVYCGIPVVFSPTFHLLGLPYPDLFPYHPNWPGGKTHPAVILLSAVVDHKDPVASGGDGRDPGNLATACNPCNKRKGDLPQEEFSPNLLFPHGQAWDGLTSFYAPLWERVEPQLRTIAAELGWTAKGIGKEIAYHRRWLAALARECRHLSAQ